MFGPEVKDILEALSSDQEIAVAGEVTVYSKTFELKMGVYFGIAYKATATGSPDLKIELEQSWVKPAVEGSVDTDNKSVVPVGMADIETNLTTELWKIKSLSPVPFKYARLKITGNSGNPASTVLQAKLSMQEDY